MKLLYRLLLAISMILPLKLFGQEPVSPLVFDSEKFDFGQVQEGGGTLFHTFSFVNGASTPIRISQVHASCNCVSVSYPQSVLQGGETGIISVALNPVGLGGKVVREIGVYLNDGKAGRTLEISAEIVPSEYDIKEAFKVALPDGLRLEGLSKKFGYVPVGSSSEKHIAIINDSSSPITLETETVEPGSHLTVASPSSLAPGEAGAVILRYNMPSKAYGAYEDEVRIFVNGAPCNRLISVSAIAVDDFSSTDGAVPVMQIYPSLLDVKKIPLLDKYFASFEIKNNGMADLLIRKIETSDGAGTDLPDGAVIKPGQKRKFLVHSVSPSFRVGVVANDPLRPYKELRTE
ncbi:MAG: DUF1573 domain-containing protein [Bacteroidia bacterium]|nr:DUF1573 domain-containing protein [Bacteroidia bacterium]